MPTIGCRGVSPEEKRGGRGPWNWGSVDEAARLVSLTVVVGFLQISVTTFVVVHKPFSWSELMEVTPDNLVKSEEPQVSMEEENQNQWVKHNHLNIQKPHLNKMDVLLKVGVYDILT